MTVERKMQQTVVVEWFIGDYNADIIHKKRSSVCVYIHKYIF